MTAGKNIAVTPPGGQTIAVQPPGGQTIAVQPLGGERARGRHIALVPGADVPLLALELPARLRGPAREDVARRQLRDRIGAAGDQIEMRPFFAPGGADVWSRALVADKALLTRWRGQAAPGCRAVLPDYLALPAAPELWTIKAESDSVQARLGLEDGFSADPDLARLMLTMALDAEGPAPPRAVLLLGDQTGWIESLMAARGIAAVHDPAAAVALGLPRPEPLAHGELHFDLRADPRAARARLRARVLPWRWPLLIGLVAAGLWAGAEIVAIRALDQAKATEQAAMLAQVRASLIPAGPILDVRAQVSRALAERQDAMRDWQDQVSPLALFAQVAPVIANSSAASESVTFDRTGLTLVLRLADFAAAETLVKALRATPLQVEVVDMRVSDGQSAPGAGVRAELRVGLPP